MEKNLFSVREVSSRLGVKWYRIKYAHNAGLVAEPMRVANHRLYSEADIKRLETYFAEKGGGNEPTVQ